MEIRCTDCGHAEKVNHLLVAKAPGISAVGFGGYAWIAYLFAGTGLALPICAALAIGGAGLLAFRDEIVKWLEDRYPCPHRGARKAWEYLA